MKLSIIMPVYNEARTIEEILERVLRVEVGLEMEIIVVDDGSSDGTSEVLKAINNNKVKVFFHERNQGKGMAVRTGLRSATGDLILIQDTDLEYDPADYPALIEPIMKGVADVVFGSRFLGGRPKRCSFFWNRIGNTVITFLTDLLFNTTLTDIETGYKVFRRGVLESFQLRSRDFCIEVELAAKVCKGDFRIYEVPIAYYGRSYKEGKKIHWYHGVTAIWTLIKYRFVN